MVELIACILKGGSMLLFLKWVKKIGDTVTRKNELNPCCGVGLDDAVREIPLKMCHRKSNSQLKINNQKIKVK